MQNNFFLKELLLRILLKITILIFGHACGFNTQEREKEFRERLEKQLPGTTPEAYDLIKTVVRCTG
jgi:hypothetical protein